MLQESLDYLTASESWWGRNGLVTLLWNHVRLSVFTVVVAAAALYAGLGFVVVGRRERYYPDGEDALLLTRRFSLTPSME